jgi:type II secretory pathway pseudopilin PulG
METLNDTPRRIRRAGGDVEMNWEKNAKNTMTRLPLRHEVGERAGVRWCSGFRGKTVLKEQPTLYVISNRSRRDAFTLIETLVYMSMLLVLMALGYTAMYRSMDASSGLRRNASDITRALDAGEHWREDIRTATQPPRVERISDRETLLHIPHAHGEITYRFADNRVTRRVGSSEWSPALELVEKSTFISDPRQNVTAWKWEVELQPYRKSLTRLHPLFTFFAVPTNAPAK